MWEAAPCSSLPTADENAATESAVTTVSSSWFQIPTVVTKNEPWRCSVLLSGLVRPLVLKVAERDANRQFAKNL